MLAARTVADEDTLLTTALGFGLLLLFVGALLTLHVRRWRRHGFAPRLRRAARRLHDALSSRTPAAGEPSLMSAPAAPHVGTGQASPASVEPGTGGGVGEATVATPAEPRSRSGPPALPGVRHSPETLEPLAGQLDRSRRLAVCERRVGEVLGQLPRDRWLVEPYVLVDGHRIPYMVLGETGVFTIWPVDGAVGQEDVTFFNELTDAVQHKLPGYAGTVIAAVCQVLDPRGQPQLWYLTQERTAGWLLGLDWLIAWLEHFGTDHGLAVKDIERLDEMAGPHWKRRPRSFRIPAHPNLG
jgi:hypothetical protein